MFDKRIFVFGSEIFAGTTTSRDAISSLPLELAWKIFSYLDNEALRTATHTYRAWKRIITSSTTLRERLNLFELATKLGSESLARFYKANKKLLKKEKKKNYLALGECNVRSKNISTTTVYKGKRRGDDLIIYTKRFKLF